MLRYSSKLALCTFVRGTHQGDIVANEVTLSGLYIVSLRLVYSVLQYQVSNIYRKHYSSAFI